MSELLPQLVVLIKKNLLLWLPLLLLAFVPAQKNHHLLVAEVCNEFTGLILEPLCLGNTFKFQNKGMNLKLKQGIPQVEVDLSLQKHLL